MAKGFDTGGFTGSGNPKEPAGIVHKGEVVFSAQDVARHGGVANVEALRQGIVSPGSKPLAVQAFAVAGAQGPAGKSGRTNIDNRIAFGFYDDKASTIKFLNSQEGQNWFVHMQDKTAHRVGRT